MENCKVILEKICAEFEAYYSNEKSSYEAYNTFVCALAKYDLKILDIVFDTKKDIDYRKVIWQIMVDLRRAKDIDLDYDNTSAGYDDYYLYLASDIIEKEGKNLDERISETSALNHQIYTRICQREGLIG